MRGGSLKELVFSLVDGLNILAVHLLALLPRKISIGNMRVAEKDNTDTRSLLVPFIRVFSSLNLVSLLPLQIWKV